MRANVILLGGLLLAGRALGDEPKDDAGKAIALVEAYEYCYHVCYYHAWEKDKKLAGDLVFDFTIDTEGRVASGGVTGVNAEVAACATEFLGRLAFEKPPAPLNVKKTFKYDGPKHGLVGGGSPCGCKRCGVPEPLIPTGRYGAATATTTPASALLRVKLGEPKVDNPRLAVLTVRRYLKHQVSKLAQCHDQAGGGKEVTLELRYTIAPNGSVPEASVGEGVPAELAGCVTAVVKGMFHPKLARAAKVTVAVTLLPAASR